jgi:Uri superfamily endonuclease
LYTGSAKNGLKSRIERHLRKNKKHFWHIDYFLKYGKVVDIYLYPENEKTECEINQRALALNNAKLIMPKFGSSDCRCSTHLVYFKTRNDVRKNLSR